MVNYQTVEQAKYISTGKKVSGRFLINASSQRGPKFMWGDIGII